MGNAIGKRFNLCCSGKDHRRDDAPVVGFDPSDEGLGHSFCYVRPDPSRVSSSKVYSEESSTTFRTISGASVSANTSTPLSTSLSELSSYSSLDRPAAVFESSVSFASIPLQPVPRMNSGPIPLASSGVTVSGPMERGFLSGPIERGFLSGPIDRGLTSGPLLPEQEQLQRSFSHGGYQFKHRSKKSSLLQSLRKAISKKMLLGCQNSMVAPVKVPPILVKDFDWSDKTGVEKLVISGGGNLSSELSMGDDDSLENQELQWAQGKAGEDSVHVVVSEENEWVFVGIYDGFNGPDATDYLLSNLYPAVCKELKGLLWEDKFKSPPSSDELQPSCESTTINLATESRPQDVETTDCNQNPGTKKGRGNFSKNKFKTPSKKREERQKRWKCEWQRERRELEGKLKGRLMRSRSNESISHKDVLKALSEALQKTEAAFLDIADKIVNENPELALMGSCVLVMLMKGEDVYLMNVGDSRAIVAQTMEPELWECPDLERIREETSRDLEADLVIPPRSVRLNALQLTLEHSTSIDEELQRITNEHPDDASALLNDRVKGSLKVTRAFGAGYLKQPKWNDALLEMFRINYIGTSSYINCVPFLRHHRLGPKDKFLILSSDGLYQYFTNEEAVAEVQDFIALTPEGDPAQHLVEEVLFRAAKKAGMDFHELLEIPQGDRRRYHDDVSIIIISFEGRIWKSSV